MHERDVNDEGASANLHEGNEAASNKLGDTSPAEGPADNNLTESLADTTTVADAAAGAVANSKAPNGTPPVIEAPKKGGSAWKFTGGVFLGLILFVGIMIAIGARWENADLSPQAPSELELTRQNLAEQAARIDASASKLRESKDDATVELVALSAERYLDLLGGVWVPWPSGAPSGYTNPPVATAAPTDVTSAVLAEELTAFSQDLLNAADNVPDTTRSELLSAALGSQFLAMNLAGSTAPTCGDVDIPAAGIALAGTTPGKSASADLTPSRSSHAGTTRTTSASTSTPATSTGHSATTDQTAATPTSADSSVLRTIDSARQWLETDTAALADGSRDAQVARIEKFSALEESILRAGAPDTRDAYAPYPELAEGETYTSQALRVTTAEILKTATTANKSDRENLMALACSLHLTAAERASALPFPGSE